MSDNIRTALYDAVYDCRLVSRSSEVDGTGAATLSRVVGKHCESGDIVVRDCWLPADLAPGDLLAVAATGAYCYAMASSLQPAAAARGRRRARRRARGCCCAARPKRTCSGWRWPVSAGDEQAERGACGAGGTAIRVAMLGCGTVGGEVVRLLREQADDLAARVGAPVELVGVAVRRPHRHPELGDLLTTDASALVTRVGRGRRRRGDRRHRAGAHAGCWRR